MLICHYLRASYALRQQRGFSAVPASRHPYTAGGAIGRHYADFMQVSVWRRANRFCGSAKRKGGSAMAAQRIFNGFMINLSQVILAYGRCSVDVMSTLRFLKIKSNNRIDRLALCKISE